MADLPAHRLSGFCEKRAECADAVAGGAAPPFACTLTAFDPPTTIS